MIKQTFKNNQTDLSPETRLDLVNVLESHFTKKAGGDLFVVKFGADKFRYEYLDEWIEFEPLNHLSMLSSSLSNSLEYSNYWQDTNLKFTVKEYGVKVDIILISDAAPKEYQFRVSKSKDWKDEWIKPPTISGFMKDWPTYKWPFSLVMKPLAEGILTYTIPQQVFDNLLFPLILDPTFYLGGNVDDTFAHIEITTPFGNRNEWDAIWGACGRAVLGGTDFQVDGYMRIAVNIPRASKILTSNWTLDCAIGSSVNNITFQITALNQSGSPAWRETGGTGGFHNTNYVDGSALLAISDYAQSLHWTPPRWFSGTSYDTRDITPITQLSIDSPYYDPLSSIGTYIGFHFDDGNGEYVWPGDVRYWDSYDFGGIDPEFNVTFEPWAEIRTANGMKYDPVLEVYRYFDY